MKVVTGAAGFIGSCLISELNTNGHHNIIAVDDFSYPAKAQNLENKKIELFIERDAFLAWFEAHAIQVTEVYHIGARTDTTEMDSAIFDELNLNYSKEIWRICSLHKLPLIYASSAATYGMGEFGYSDSHEIIPSLQPLNPYGASKNDFDKWVLLQDSQASFWAGLKFFNIYGPNEYHKGRMASVIFHTHKQILEKGSMRLFRSHKPEYLDGHQSRDFVYVMDLISVILFLMETKKQQGIYNLGSGVANTFIDLASYTFEALGKTPNISFIDTPEDLRETYQYYTCADMTKLKQVGYSKPFYSLKDGVFDYVRNYLLPGRNF